MPPRLSFPIFSSSSDNRAALFQGLVIAALVITGLSMAREVLLPLAVAMLLSFVLTPPLLFLRKLHVPRVLSVVIVVTFAFSIIFALGWILSQQATDLAENLPRYQFALSDKIGKLRQSAGSLGVVEKIGNAVTSIQRDLTPQPTGPAATNTSIGNGQTKPVIVEIHQAEAPPLRILQDVAGTILPPLATAGIIILFVIFMLLQREDLRDRLIRIMGSSDIQRATATLNDGATRLSKYFLRQVLINASFGVFIACGLALIGVPSPIGWGVLAALMRFVPYVGSFISAAPPMLLAAVVDPGWTTVILTGVLFLVSELIMGQVVEPLVYGHGTGLSPIAVIISTVFWTWLWGPLGLLLATPLTVCLAVLGRHVEGLNFLDILLGDEPALTPSESFYQRVLIGDSAEATYQAELSLKEGTALADYLDDVALGGLRLAERDAERGTLEGEQMERIERTISEMMENLADFEPRRWFRKVQPEKPQEEDTEAGGLASLTKMEEDDSEANLPILAAADLASGWDEDDAVLCIGGRTPLDEAAAELLAGILKRHGLKANAMPAEALAAGNIVSLEASKAKLICLSYLAAGGSAAPIRYLVRRLRRILPKGSLVLVGYWADEGAIGPLKALKATAEADAYATSLEEAASYCISAARGQIEQVEAATPPPAQVA